MVIYMRMTRPLQSSAKVPGWWQPAANDARYPAAYRLTEFGLAD